MMEIFRSLPAEAGLPSAVAKPALPSTPSPTLVKPPTPSRSSSRPLGKPGQKAPQRRASESALKLNLVQTEVLSAQEDKKGDAKGHCCPACWKRAKCTYTTCECSRAGKQCVNCHSPCCGNDGKKESIKSKNQGESVQSKDGKKQGASAAQNSENELDENDTKGELERLPQQVA